MISIIMPVFNGEKYVGDTISSILNQNYHDFELIVVDDGSTDNTRLIVLNQCDDRIKYFYKANTGVSETRNFGLKEATGEYVIFFDADDLMSQSFLLTRYKKMKAENHLDFCGGEVKKMIKEKIENTTFLSITDNMFTSILHYDQDLITCPSSYLFKRSFLLENHFLFNEKLSNSADKFFLLQCSQKGSYGFEHNGYLIYRVHESSMSNQINRKNIEDNKIYLKEVLKIFSLKEADRNKFVSILSFNIGAESWSLNKFNVFEMLYYLSISFLNFPRLKPNPIN